MKRLLIVDDEDLFRRSLADGLQAREPGLAVDVAANGLEAMERLARTAYDLVLTDLKMPEMDGFDLLAHMSRRHPRVPVLVMTAFGTDEIAERLREAGVDGYVEKPVDFDDLTARIMATLARGASGFVQGITLPTFLQIVALEAKTCALRCSSHGREGTLHVQQGHLVGARWDATLGDDAALEVLSWEDVAIEILAGGRVEGPTSGLRLENLLLEAMRLRDEAARKTTAAPDLAQPQTTADDKEKIMALKDHLMAMQTVEGFVGASVYSGSGEALESFTTNPRLDMKAIGSFANNSLLNAQKATEEMGVGRGNALQIRAPQATVLMRCLNEATDFASNQAGHVHIHAVVVMNPEGNVGMASMMLDKAMSKMAEELR